MVKTGRWASAKAMHQARTASPDDSALIQYHVTLPQRLPIPSNEVELHNVYSKIRKIGYTMARTSAQAINNFFYARLGSYAKLIYHTLKVNGRRLDAIADEVCSIEDSESEQEHNARLQGAPKAVPRKQISDEEYRLRFGTWKFH